MKKQIEHTKSAEETMRLADSMGARLRGGETLELVSDLGGGKTTFVRGLANGIGSKDQVRSPSFTLSNEYRTGKLTLHHLDFYRLREAGIMRDELAEIVGDPLAVVVIEWGDVVNDVLPANRVTINIKTSGPSSRELIISYPDELEYLINKT